MDPLTVLKTVWHHKWFVLPVVLLTLASGTYVFLFAPRAYQSSISYALVNPAVPTQDDKAADPSLADLNSDNPYLRSSDPSLISQVVIGRLGSEATILKAQAAGHTTDYSVARPAGSSGFIIDITATGSTPDQAAESARFLGKELESILHSVQTVNGADDRYIFEPLVVTGPSNPLEQFSSRLRSLIVVMVGGVVLAFAAVSVARSVELARAARPETRTRRRKSGSHTSDLPEQSLGASPATGMDGTSAEPLRQEPHTVSR